MKTVEIFSDGACKGNPGPGGWGVVLRYGRHERCLYGAEGNTTNNRMELTAALEGLNALKEPCRVVLTTDSEYVRRGITEWLETWKAKDWKTSTKQAVKNQDLWQALEQAARPHQVEWHWVKGHSGHKENEMADQLANKAIEELTIKKAGSNASDRT